MVVVMMVTIMPTGIVIIEIGIVPGIIPYMAVVITGISPIAAPVVSPRIVPVATPSVRITHYVV
jgi:hypothetical protein